MLDQPLIGKKKSLQNYLDAHLLKVKHYNEEKSQNHYITKKSYKYLNFVIEAARQLKADEIEQIIKKTLVARVDKEFVSARLFKKMQQDFIPESYVVEESANQLEKSTKKPIRLVI
jgi:hypothetical protein